MGRISKILLALIVGGGSVGVFVYFMGYPGLNEFVGYPLMLKIAYAGCALSALVMGPGALVFALTGGSGEPKAPKPKTEKKSKKDKKKKDEAPADEVDEPEDELAGDDWGDSEELDEFEDADGLSDDDLAFEELDDDEFK